ncbi:MAG: hypothetical protein IJJ60_05850, partial [Clostridia bacterium]|nr:hypothetical protein [Clostridia bacterium]
TKRPRRRRIVLSIKNLQTAAAIFAVFEMQTWLTALLGYGIIWRKAKLSVSVAFKKERRRT